LKTDSKKTFDAVGLDAGSAWTRCVIFQLEGDRVRFVGCGEAPSKGWVKGRIADQNAASESMRAALHEAEQSARISVGAAVVGIGGSVRGANCRGFLDLGRLRTVDQRDVNRAVERASRVRLQEDRLVLQMLPQDFLVDGHPGHRDPRKMVAGQIEANVHLVTASVREHECLVAAVNQAHLAVEDTVFEPFAACYAALRSEDRRDGAAVLSIGAHTAELVVYYGEALQLACSVPISGDHFTRDVARGLRISFEDAATVKHEFGCAAASSTAENSFVDIPSRDNRDFQRRTLNNILEARAEELFKYVHEELTRVGMQGALIGGLFMAGGGSRLDGMCDLAERILECPVRIALPFGIQDWPEEIFDPVWTTAAGLAMYSAKLKSQNEIQRQSIGLLGRILK
jgi:cell division protein FtsA